MSGLFISYRRDDSQGFAGRLANDLSLVFGSDQVFSDIEIPFGSDFGEVLHRAIAASDALLVVIGRHWAAASGTGRPSRLFEAGDWVRTEIEAALAQGKGLIPVLVGGAAMPAATDLPESIRRLVRLQAAGLDDRHWRADLEQLVARVQELVPGLPVASARGAEASPGGTETPVQVLREIAQRVLEESTARRPGRRPPPVPAPRTAWAWVPLSPLLRVLRQLLSIAVVIALIYVGIRLFGDDSLLRQLDLVEARLLRGWGRLLRYLGTR